jgi:cholesterol transport system auxiliary component
MMNKLSLLIFCCLLSACSLLEKTEPLPLYTLKSEAFKPSYVLSAPLAIDVPLSEASLNTPRIAVTPYPYQRDYMADGEWPDRLPKVFQEVLLQGLTQRWGGTNVNRMSAGVQTHYLLQSEIQDFSVYHLNKNMPEVHLTIVFKLINLRDRRVIASQTFCEIAPPPSPTMQGIACAFNKGVHCLLLKAVSWMENIFLKESLLNSRDDKLSGKGS